MTRATDKTAPEEVEAITAALQGFIPVLEDVDLRQRAYIYTEDATFRDARGTPAARARGDARP